jgi:hypothetical protein
MFTLSTHRKYTERWLTTSTRPVFSGSAHTRSVAGSQISPRLSLKEARGWPGGSGDSLDTELNLQPRFPLVPGNSRYCSAL